MSRQKEPCLYARIFSDASFPSALLAIDEGLAESARARGCATCGAALHSARYPRKPRGGPWALGAEHDVRHSLCCSREGCRRRTTPGSVRFLGRRVYLAAVVVLAAVLGQGVSGSRASRLSRLIGADRRTLERWRSWWLETRTLCLDGFVPPIDRGTLPSSLLTRFRGCAREQLLGLLGWLSNKSGQGD